MRIIQICTLQKNYSDLKITTKNEQIRMLLKQSFYKCNCNLIQDLKLQAIKCKCISTVLNLLQR